MKRIGNIPLTMLAVSPNPFAGFDGDAAAFLTSGGYIDAVILATINAHAATLKGISDKANFVADYPFVTDLVNNTDRLGQFKFNLFDPQDTNAARRLAYSGSITATPQGIQGGGNGSANTFINPTLLTGTEFCIYHYSRTNQVRNEVDWGCNYVNPNILHLASKYGDNNTYVGGYAAESAAGVNAVTNTAGFFLLKRIGNTVTLKRNNVVVNTWNVSAPTKPNSNMLLMCYANNLGAPTLFSTKQYSHWGMLNIGTTNGQDTALYNAVVAKETALNRFVA